MLKSSLNYPYPVLRKNAVDYKESVFTQDISVTAKDAGFEVKVACTVNNNEILEHIADGTLSYGLQIECKATWMRKFIKSFTPEFTAFFSRDDVYEKVELCPCIVADSNINGYTNDDFTEDYADIRFNIRKGEIIACGAKEKFDAVYEKDILKNASSIFNIKCDDERNTISYSPEYERINVYLPKKTHEQYNYHKVDALRHPVLNAAVIVPILVDVLHLMKSSNEQYSEKRWHKTIKNKLTKLSNGVTTVYDRLLDDPVGTAQLLVGDSAFQAMINLKLLVEKGE